MARKKLKTMNEISAAEAVKLFHAAMNFDYGIDGEIFYPKEKSFPKDIAAKDFMESLVAYRDMWRVYYQEGAYDTPIYYQDYDQQRAELANTVTGIPKQDLVQFTPKELEVFSLLKEGLQDKEIAAKLNKGIGTVKFQVSSIIKKLGVHTRTQAITQAPTDLNPPKQS